MNWLYWGVGGFFLIKFMEKSRFGNFRKQAQQARAEKAKPICLISSGTSSGFDVQVHPNQSLNLPYGNKYFAALVSDSLEEITDTQAALVEWQRVADKVFINTHFFFSPEAWLDLKHKHVFMGKTMLNIQPPLNWGIAGGLGYYFFYLRKKKKPNQPMLPATLPASKLSKSDIEEAPLVEPEEARYRNTGHEAQEISLDGLDGRILDIGGKLELDKKDKLVLDPNMPEEYNQTILTELELNPADVAIISKFDELPNDEKEATIQIAEENIKSGGKVYIPTKKPGYYLGKVRKFFPKVYEFKGFIEAEK